METPNNPEDRKAEMDQLYKEFENEQVTSETDQQLYKTGKRLVIGIVAVAAAQLLLGQGWAIANNFYRVTYLISLLLWGAILFNLYRGKHWARIVFIVLSLLSALNLVLFQSSLAPSANVYFVAQQGSADSYLRVQLLLALAAVSAIIGVISCMLLYSRQATAFLDKQKMH